MRLKPASTIFQQMEVRGSGNVPSLWGMNSGFLNNQSIPWRKNIWLFEGSRENMGKFNTLVVVVANFKSPPPCPSQIDHRLLDMLIEHKAKFTPETFRFMRSEDQFRLSAPRRPAEVADERETSVKQTAWFERPGGLGRVFATERE